MAPALRMTRSIKETLPIFFLFIRSWWTSILRPCFAFYSLFWNDGPQFDSIKIAFDFRLSPSRTLDLRNEARLSPLIAGAIITTGVGGQGSLDLTTATEAQVLKTLMASPTLDSSIQSTRSQSNLPTGHANSNIRVLQM